MSFPVCFIKENNVVSVYPCEQITQNYVELQMLTTGVIWCQKSRLPYPLHSFYSKTSWPLTANGKVQQSACFQHPSWKLCTSSLQGRASTLESVNYLHIMVFLEYPDNNHFAALEVQPK